MELIVASVLLQPSALPDVKKEKAIAPIDILREGYDWSH